ncbi:MAG TPA: STAS domain-containing protein [Isosphaeraceae bacterium]|jgi:anti-anti-sigma factor|nr:STAS domain-containing protein [Isosphaeraceae bacterium]
MLTELKERRLPRTIEEEGVLILTIDSPEALDDESRSYHEAVQRAAAGRSRPRVAVDLARVDVLSSTGVGLLVALRRRVAAEGGRLVLFDVRPEVRSLLQTTALERLFLIAEDRTSALALLHATPSL